MKALRKPTDAARGAHGWRGRAGLLTMAPRPVVGRLFKETRAMQTSLRLTLTAACTVLAAAPALAQTSGLRSERTLTLELASQIATRTVAACQANGHNVAAAVVDRSGQLRALLRGDNAGAHTIESARQKAFTSASARVNTLQMMENAQKNPAAANLVHIPGFLLLGGGVPVRVGNEVVGAVGVAGAPGGHLDEQCAVAALDAVKDQLK